MIKIIEDFITLSAGLWWVKFCVQYSYLYILTSVYRHVSCEAFLPTNNNYSFFFITLTLELVNHCFRVETPVLSVINLLLITCLKVDRKIVHCRQHPDKQRQKYRCWVERHGRIIAIAMLRDVCSELATYVSNKYYAFCKSNTLPACLIWLTI